MTTPGSAPAELWVSIDDFAHEFIRWMLDVADGHSIVITRDGAPMARVVPASTWEAITGVALDADGHEAPRSNQ